MVILTYTYVAMTQQLQSSYIYLCTLDGQSLYHLFICMITS